MRYARLFLHTPLFYLPDAAIDMYSLIACDTQIFPGHSSGLCTKSNVQYKCITKYKLLNAAGEIIFVFEDILTPNGPQSWGCHFKIYLPGWKLFFFLFQLHENISPVVLKKPKVHLWSRKWLGADHVQSSEPMVTLFTAIFVHHMSSTRWYIIRLDRLSQCERSKANTNNTFILKVAMGRYKPAMTYH